MSKLLVNEHPLIVLPSLAVALESVNAAIVLQQIHYWINDKRAPVREGRRWHYEKYESWLIQFPWLSNKTLRRIVDFLEKRNLIISKEFNRLRGDRTKWYTVNYEALQHLELSLNIHVDNLTTPSGHTDQTMWSKRPDIYKEEETNKETNKDIKPPKPPKGGSLSYLVEDVFERFWGMYPNKKGKEKAKQSFMKLTKSKSKDEIEELTKKMTEGLLCHLVECKHHDDIQKLNPTWKVFYPSWPHGSTWINQKRWLDEYETNGEEINERLKGQYGKSDANNVWTVLNCKTT